MPGPVPRDSPVEPYSRIWITLITRASYLPGVVILVHTLYKHESVHPIIIQYTSALEPECIDCLQRLTTIYPLAGTQLVDPIALPQGLKPVASRFDDTLTKLRIFQPFSQGQLDELGLRQNPDERCFLDADIAIFRNMDDMFDIPRPGPDWIAAHHACVCNIDGDPWAKPDWKPENCPSTPLVHPSALQGPVGSSSKERPTYQLCNSGVFVCTPSQELWEAIEDFRQNDPRVASFTFPDQNFVDTFFRDRWVSIGWQYNAIKTGRYWHPSMWRDAEVRALHYIVDKPWDKRVGEDGTAGYLGRDGVTHRWWWDEYELWERSMENGGHEDVLGCVRRYVATPSATNGHI